MKIFYQDGIEIQFKGKDERKGEAYLTIEP